MKISILVPVYGVEKYIPQCAKTLFEQTYHDIEYIFVDDCSPDDSIMVLQQILANYPERKSQVHIVRHDHNRGLGAARKTAFEAATGDFVINVDSDDYLSLNAVELLVAKQQETGADIVSSSYTSVFQDGTAILHAEPHYSKDDCLKLMLIQNTLLPHIWARLIRRSLYIEHGISSVEGINMAEDLALTPRLIHAATSISYVKESTYYYRDDSSASTFANQLSRKQSQSGTMGVFQGKRCGRKISFCLGNRNDEHLPSGIKVRTCAKRNQRNHVLQATAPSFLCLAWLVCS